MSEELRTTESGGFARRIEEGYQDSLLVKSWKLLIELGGEWEECSYPTRDQALTSFAALASDYRAELKKALLISGRLAREGKALNVEDRGSRVDPRLLN